jgi:RNA polymerase sigma factor (sigma-70 family)
MFAAMQGGKRMSSRKRTLVTKRPNTDDLVLKHQGLVHKEANSVVRRLGAPQLREDLVSAGQVGLVQYAKRYDPKRGAFSTGATQAIRAKIQREVQKTQTVKVGEKSVAKLAKRDALPKTGEFKPEHEKAHSPMDTVEHRADVTKLMKRLSPEERNVIKMRHLEGYTTKQVAARTKKTVRQVRKIEKQSLERMRG